VIKGFKLNELLKNELVLKYGATYAKSEFFKNGTGIIHEPFLETIVRWEEETDVEVIYEALREVITSRIAISKIAEMTLPHIETSLGRPQIVWAIFEL
jgi:hypothetical protein